MTDALAPEDIEREAAIKRIMRDLAPHIEQTIRAAMCSAEARALLRPSSPGDAERDQPRRDHLIVAANLIKSRIQGVDTPFESEAIDVVEKWLRSLAALLRTTPQPAGPAPGWRLVPTGTLLALFDMSRVDDRMHALFRKMLDMPLPAAPEPPAPKEGV